MSNSCDTKGNCCDTQASNACCACGTDCCGDVLECSSQLWKQSFFQAMRQVQVDILKAKIQKNWGPTMEKAADAVLEAMSTKFDTMIRESKAKSDLRSKLASLWSEKK